MNRKRVVIISILVAMAIHILNYFNVFWREIFPPINDPAIWLKNANGFLGNTYPLWNQTLFQYPPLFNMILALAIYLTKDPLTSVKFLGLLLIWILPLASYPIVKEVTGSSEVGAVAVWLFAFHPSFAEMYGWGGYPNLLGLIFLLLTTYLLLRIYNAGSLRYVIGASISASLLVFSHHLTTIVYSAIAFTWLIIITYKYFKGVISSNLALKSLTPIFISGGAFLLWRYLAGPFQYITYNYASLVLRPFDLDAFWWIFKDQISTALLFILAVLGFITLYVRGSRESLTILFTWIIFPFLFTQSYIFGIALDFKRFPIFSVPPILILASASLINISGSKLIRRYGDEYYANLDRSILLSMAVGLIILTLSIGIAMPYKISEYYHYLTDYAYGVEEKLDALNWIIENTPRDAVIVADEGFGRWIEGYAGRRVLMALPPYQIFIKGEYRRFEASNLIMTTNIELRNEYIRISDDTPYLSNRTPWIAFSNGKDYINLIYLIDGTFEVLFNYSGSTWIESPYKAEIHDIRWIVRNGEVAKITISYRTKSLQIDKTLELRKGEKSIYIEYDVIPLIDAELIYAKLPIWIPYGSKIDNILSKDKELSIKVEGVPVKIIGSSEFDIGPDDKWGQNRVLLIYRPVNNEIHARLTITFPSAKKNIWGQDLYASTSDEEIEKYNVKYIALAKEKNNYIRFLKDPRFKTIYENNKIIIFTIEEKG